MMPPLIVHPRWRPAVPLTLVALTAAWLAGRDLPQTPVLEAEVLLAAPAALVVPAAQAQPQEAAPAGAAVVDIFAVRTWEPPPPPPPPEAAAAPPQPPALPFRYFGRISEPDKPDTFLLFEGERIHRVRVGDSIGRNYRVDKFDHGRLLLRYRPMNVTQALAVDSPT